MPSSNICWGIEIGAGAIKALKLERAGDSVNVLDYAVVPHKKVLSTPGLDQADAIRVALGAFTNQFDLTGTSVAMSVPGHSAFARFAKLPPVEPKKVPDIVKFEAVQQIPFPINEVEWDYQTFISPDSPDVEVGIFAITRERMMEKLRQCEDVNLVPNFVTLSPVAAYNALAFDLAFTEQTPGTIILDIGTTSTDLIVAEAGRVWIRTFPIGGHHFTDALVNGFKLGYPKAEKLKREAEQSKHARHIFQAMRPVFSDLAQDVQRSIGYYQSLHRDAKLVRLIGLGSTFRLPGLRKYLKQQLQMDVYRMEQFKRLSIDGPRAGEFQAAALNMATAYGLALQGLGMQSINANLMPVSVMRSAMWARKIKWFGLAAGITVAAGAAMFLRPFLDSSAVAGTTRDPIIADVIREASSLKSQANEVTTSGATDLAAANMISLVDSEGVYQHLANDLSLMLEDAQAKAPPPAEGAAPAYMLKTFTTTYVPPAVAATPDGSAEPPPDEGGRRRGGIGSNGEESPSAVGSGISPELAAHRRVHVEMEVATTQPEPQKFMLATLAQWLKDNKEREGVPYTIITGGRTWELVSRREIKVGDAGTTEPGTEIAAGGGGEVVGEVDQRGGDARGGRGRRGVSQAQERPARTQRRTAQEISSDLMGAGAAERRAYGEQAARDEAIAALEGLAPLPPAPPVAEPGSTLTVFRIRWDAVLVPPTPENQEEGGR